MATVKFDHKVKYHKEWHPAHTAFHADECDVPALKAAGAQVLSRDESSETPPANDDKGNTPAAGETGENASESGDDTGDDEPENDASAALKEELLTYSLDKLNAFAKEHDIDLKGKTRKAEVYNAIIAAL